MINFRDASPPSELVTEPEHEALLDLRVGDFLTGWALRREIDPTLPDYDVENLETSPFKIAAESAAFGDLYFLQALNETARSTILIDFATGSDLDDHGSEPGIEVARLDDEDDDRYRRRIKLKKQGRSAAGPREWWLYHALTADIRVKDVATSYLGGNVLEIAIQSTDNGGEASDDLIQAVAAYLNDDGITPDRDIIQVVPAVFITVEVMARVWMYPSAPASVFESLESNLRTDWDSAQRLGLDLSDTWVSAHLHPEGVHRVELIEPAQTVVAGPSRAIRVGSIDIELAGIDE